MQAYTFVREFLVGSNTTGLVQNNNGAVNVVGGENPTLQQAAVPGQEGIAYGSATTQGTTAWPSATIAAFQSHVGLVSVTGTNAIQPTATSGAALSVVRNSLLLPVTALLLLVIAL